MALRMEVQTTAGGSFVEIDIAAYKLFDFKLRVGYSHPVALSFKAVAAGHTYPLGIRNFVRVWDDAGTTPDSAAQSSSNPFFEGFIEEVLPVESNVVSITCYDPTSEAGRNFPIMAQPWQVDGGTGAIIEGTTSFPRLVFNSAIRADDDWAFEREHTATCGRIIKVILDDQQLPLAYFNASGSPAYDSTELSALDFIPQEKEVFENESVRSGIERVLRYHPTRRLLWRPGVRQWRFPDLYAASSVTLTMNESSGPLMNMDITRSIANRYTAVRFYGPITSTLTVASTADGSLADISDSVSLQGNPPTCCDVAGINRWIITDPNKRNIANRLPGFQLVQVGDYAVQLTDEPVLLGYWPNKTDAGQDGWRVILGWYWIDKAAGVFGMPAGLYATRYNPTPSSGQPNWENPTAVKLIYGVAASPLQVRYPTSGYGGTAYTVANIQNEKKIYDEMLAAYWDTYTAITTASRLAKYYTLAQYQHAMLSDIVYGGSAVLDGIDWSYLWLSKRLNFTAVDANGSSITTGWESIHAFLTDVEYDFSERLTTLSFNSDHMEMIGLDVEAAKKRLQVKAVEMRFTPVTATLSTRIRNRTISEGGRSGFSSQWNVHETTVQVSGGQMYFADAETGRIEQ